MARITNPILPGFHPDPSICRVEDDYYIATSTFEWFPGVRVFHSRDLMHWRLAATPLDRTSLLDMRGNPNSGGIWAPCLSYADGLFWLVYTDVKNLSGPFKDTHNFLTTAPAISGPWSEPVFLNSSGFDPSLFHDEDGRKWLVNMVWDHRKGRNPFNGIVLQEYSPLDRRLIGPIHRIFEGTSLGATEGPHLYHHDGRYYLMCAEGGTGRNHAVTMARADNILGPYEVDPQNPMLTSRNHPNLELQKAGHASLIRTRSGEWYVAHLCGRPADEKGRCILGRETALQKCVWTAEGWLRLEEGGNTPKITVPAPDLPPHPFPIRPARDDFDVEALSADFCSLRIPIDPSWASLSARPGHLRLYGRESLGSRHQQSLIARRVEAFHTVTTTCMRFTPDSFQQSAGLTAYYNTDNLHYLCVSHDERHGRVLRVVTLDNGTYSESAETAISSSEDCLYLRVEIDHERLRFSWSYTERRWAPIGSTLDAGILSDEHVHGDAFTGAFVGICCQDLSGRRRYADFDWFEYREV